MDYSARDERLVSKMEGKTNFSRCLNQFDGLNWLIPTPPPPFTTTPLCQAVSTSSFKFVIIFVILLLPLLILNPTELALASKVQTLGLLSSHSSAARSSKSEQ